jgi:hypothetical protein
LGRFQTGGDFVGRARLVVDKRVSGFVIAPKDAGRERPAKIAIDAGVIDVERPGRIPGQAIGGIGHSGVALPGH